MGLEKKVVSVRLDEEFIQKLKELAEQQNRSLSNLVETVLKDYVSKQEKQ
jgi:predicted transcriptional regulator